MLDTFQVVSVARHLLRGAAKSAFFNFTPVTFDSGYFSSLGLFVSSVLKGKWTVHFCVRRLLLEFKFHEVSLRSSLEQR